MTIIEDLYIETKTYGYVTVTIGKPDTCPCCHKAIDSKVEVVSPFFTQSLGQDTIAVIFRCPACGKYFFKAYVCFKIDFNHFTSDFFNCTPSPDLNLNIPKEIESISPEFTEIYTQALNAEYYGLSKITGIGLRKSIEFLIKDYLINYKKEDSNTIKNIMLGKAIAKIDNSKIQTLARATTWIGNDETHYERRYKDKDVDDMKRFIKALIHFISFELTADEAEDFTASSIAK